MNEPDDRTRRTRVPGWLPDLPEYLEALLAPIPLSLPCGMAAAVLCVIVFDDLPMKACLAVFVAGYGVGAVLQVLIVRLLFRLIG